MKNRHKILSIFSLPTLLFLATASQATAATKEKDVIREILKIYEVMRLELVNDRPHKLPVLGKNLHKISQSFSKLNQTAKALVDYTQGNIEKERSLYGDLSKEIVALLIKHPEFQKGRFLYQCPMVIGYPKWVQNTDKIENPYMGQSMLACGGRTPWRL